ncbi:MAG TPA: GAF domain-containing protein, partial [Thermoleophilia bacterium]|nr:GAF domain-containing protein [Thermoleophilia bacterium]
REVVAAVASPIDLGEKLRLVARRLSEALAVSECHLYEYVGDSDQLRLVAAWGADLAISHEEWVGETVDVRERPSYRATVVDRVVTEARLDDPDLSQGDRDDMERWSELSCLSVPLVFDDQVIGIVDLVEKRAVRHFSDGEREIAATLALPAAIALREARTRRLEADQRRYLSSLVSASGAFTQNEAVDDVLDHIAQEATEALDVSQAAIYEHDEENDAIFNRVLCEREKAIAPEDPLGTAYALDKYPGERRILMSDDIVLERMSDPDLPHDRRGSLETWGEKSVLSVPLHFHDQRLGILRLYEFDVERTFSEEERRLAAGLGELASAAINNARVRRAQDDRTRQLASLLDASTAITSTVVLEDVLELVGRQTAEALGSQQCVISEYLKDHDAIATRSLYTRTDVPQDDCVREIGTVFSLDLYPSDRKLLSGGEIVQRHLGDPGLPRDVRETMDAFAEKACLNVPLLFRGEALGILALVEFDHERQFTAEEIELARGLSEQAATAIHHARLYRQQEEQNRRLVTLLEVSQRIAASLDESTVLSEVVAGVSSLFDQDTVVSRVWLRGEDDRFEPVEQPDVLEGDSGVPVVAAATAGSDAEDARVAAVLADDSSRYWLSAPASAAAGQDALVARMVESGRPSQDDLRADGHRLLLPLRVHGVLSGYVEVRDTGPDPFSDDDVQVLQVLASEATVALEKADNYGKLEATYLQTVTALAAAMEAKDQYTADHADILANMAVAIGRRLGLSETDLRNLQYAAVLHDIGKIGIPGAILNKPDRLTEDEFAVMAEHTIIGERIISQIEHLRSIGHIVRAAHERWDGSGYPDGLGGDRIPLSSRIVMVCDAYHAMTSDRPYRKALSEDVALEELRCNAGTQFDPVIVGQFLDTWPHFDGDHATAVN